MFDTISESKTVLTLVMHINICRLGYCNLPYINKSLTPNSSTLTEKLNQNKNTNYILYQEENTFLYSMSTPNIDVKQAHAIWWI